MRMIKTVALMLALATLTACDDDSPTAPTVDNMSGRWTGTSTYPNSPFQLTLTQTAGTLRGEYRDQLDRSIAVTGTFTNPAFAIVVDFGDAKLNLNGTVLTARSAEGAMFTSALGNQMFPFTMTR